MNIILTGDRPTGKLHLGHYIGSLKNRVVLQNEGNYDEMYLMIADSQALTDNFDNPKKVRDNIINVALDYLSVGIDPKKVNIFIQSQIPALTELSFYYMNLVTVSRLQRNPTVKNEIKEKSFEKSIPVGFFCYPISQAADITAFKANIIPVGNDQLPMLEQTNEIVSSFNRIYGETLVPCKAILNENKIAQRLPGLDGNAKMSKSLNNGIYLSDPSDVIYKKVMSMYTDPNHIKVEDPGKVEGNMVFTYLDVFSSDEQISKYSEYRTLDEMKKASMFVLSSNFEGMSNALIEAMCLGLPCISTKVSGSTDLINDGANGLLIDLDDREQLFNAMKRIIEDEEFALSLGMEATKIYSQLNVDKISKEWVHYINRFMSN